MQLKKANLKAIFNERNIAIAILILASLVRLFGLKAVPPGLTPDEAALGYNAYSILKTGKDEFGKVLPIVFKSFGDYKPGLYVYLAAPLVGLFGLNEFSVRLVSVLSGMFSVYLVYLILSRLFDKRLGLVGMFVAAFNPYLIYFARGAWEANVSLTLTLLGIYFFLKALEKQKYLIYASIPFALTLLTYQGAKLSTAIVLGILVLSFWKDFWKISKSVLVSSFVAGLLIATPIIMTLFNGQAERITIFSVFSYPRPISETSQYAGPLFNIFHSDQLNYFRMVMSRWFNFYSGNFLFFVGDAANPVHTPPYQGVLLLIDLLLFPVGLFAFLKNKLSGKYLFIILWLILAPLSAAITRDQTNAVRSLNAAIPMVIVISFGLTDILNSIGNFKYKVPLLLIGAGLYLASIIYFADAYFIHLPKHNSQYARYGYKQAVEYVSKQRNNYDHIVFEQSFNQPYIYFLFFEKYDPKKWQSQARLVDSQYIGDVGFEEKLDNIYFKNLDWSQLKNDHNVLIVTDPNHVPNEVKNDKQKFAVDHEIKYLDGISPAFDIISVK